MKPTRLLYHVITVCILIFAVSASAGDDAPSMEEIVVTGTKIEKKAENLTDSVTVITADEIEKNSFTDFTEILRSVPGIEFKQAGGPGQFNYPKMRGFSQGHFLVVIDWIKVNEAMRGGVSNLLGHIDPQIIERIEILRGPQAAIYGSNSTAGVIVITTKKGTEKPEVRAGGEAGSLDWRKAYASASGSAGRLGYSLYTGYTDSGGVHEYEYFRELSSSINLGYNFSDSFNVEGSFMYTDSEFNYAELRESYSDDSPSTPWWAFQLPDPNSLSASDYYNGSIRIRHEISGGLKQALTLGYYKHKKKGLDEDDGYLGSVVAPVDNFTLDRVNYYNKGDIVPVYDRGDGKPYYYQDENYLTDYNIIWDRDLGPDTLNTLLVGAEFQRQKGRKWGKYGEIDKELDNYSFYLNDQILMLNETLILSLGLRNDHHGEFGNQVTGKAGASYTFRPTGTTLYTNYGTSFKAPTFFNLYDPRYGNRELNPEKGKTYEFGVRQSFLEKRLNLECSYWQTELDDVIAFVYGINPDPAVVGMYDNRDKATSQGIETSLSFKLTDSLTFSGNYTYTDSKSEKDGETFRTVQIARNKFNLDLTYDTGKLHLNIHGYYSGPRLRWKGDKEMDSYFRTDVAARADVTENWTIYGRVENLFNENIQEGLGYEQPGVYAVTGMQWKF
ncbi:MAG: TonB-dependent receptor [Deferribacteres bacterium]|nr:TonB-dependent receptor [Deferribacteres bacterium]